MSPPTSRPRPGRRRGGWIVLLTVLGLILGGLGWWFGVERPAHIQARTIQVRAALSRARDFLQTGQTARALRILSDLPEDGERGSDVLALKGMTYATLDRPEMARPLLERSLALDRDQPMTVKVLAAIYFNDHDTEAGFRMLELAARLDPSDFRPWFAAGDMGLRFRTDPTQAVRNFREALKRQPDHLESRIGLVKVLLAVGSAEDAAPVLDALLSERPDDPEVLRLAARLARLQGRDDDVLRYAKSALTLDPGDTEALTLRAQTLLRAGRTQAALTDIERAVALTPHDPVVLALLAQIEGALGRKDRATATAARRQDLLERIKRVEALTEDVRKRPGDPEPRWKLGRAAVEAGMETLARQSYRIALSLDPNCRPAREGLAALDAAKPSP